jgi:tetratricopeptide (TPR) repeat protein
MEELGPSHRGILHLAKAFTYYHARENGNGLQDLLAAIDQLAIGGRADSAIVQLHTGLGAIASAKGEYLASREHMETAYRAASRLDNTALMGTAALNLTMCYSRLGMWNEHRTWARIAWRLNKTDAQGGYGRIHSAAESCLSAISLENRSELLTSLGWLEQSIQIAVLPWARQAGYLLKADVAWLSGDKTAAFEAAAEARRLSKQVLTPSFAGAFARWTTLLCLEQNRIEEAWELLEKLEGDLSRLDALDRAEVLSCIALVQESRALPVESAAEKARQELARLPVHCTQRMVQLGVILTSGRAKTLPKAALRS